MRRLVPREGRIAIVTDARRDAVDADGARDEGARCGRRSRVVLTPRCWRQVSRSYPRGDGGKKADHRGDHEGNRKTIARGMPGGPGVTVVTNARAFYPTRAAAGASSARHSLRPPIGGRDLYGKTRAKRRGEIADVYL